MLPVLQHCNIELPGAELIGTLLALNPPTGAIYRTRLCGHFGRKVQQCTYLESADSPRCAERNVGSRFTSCLRRLPVPCAAILALMLFMVAAKVPPASALLLLTPLAEMDRQQLPSPADSRGKLGADHEAGAP
jgi:hypothetical protein